MFSKDKGAGKNFSNPQEALRLAEIKDEIERDIVRKGKRGQAARDELDDRMADVLMDEKYPKRDRSKDRRNG